ncbi:MAG: polymer-forming cytoskeletal protein [Elusimicrobiota bacterium]
MFGSKKEQPEKLETIIGQDTIVQGTLKSKGSIRVDGRLEGGILEAAGVIVGTTGQVQGDITAKNIIVGGRVTGNVTANQTLEIQSKAQVLGDIHTAVLSINEGALFEGHCIMSAEQNKVIEMDIPAARR